jgi:hypothetical protein
MTDEGRCPSAIGWEAICGRLMAPRRTQWLGASTSPGGEESTPLSVPVSATLSGARASAVAACAPTTPRGGPKPKFQREAISMT